MSLNQLVSTLLRRKLRVKHWWREQGEPNQFRILVDINHPDGTKETKWVGVVQLNGEMPLVAQTQVMARMCWALDIKG